MRGEITHLPVDTERASHLYREKTLDGAHERVLMTRVRGSTQESDLQSPVNCGGFGRIRHFRRATSAGWPENPLPIDPASRALGLPDGLEAIEAQVFQNAACNWRCWYCFVPFNRLNADPRYSEMMSLDKLVSDYSALTPRPPVLDLSGGQPDLTPEYVLWAMRALKSQGLAGTTMLWSDDNLSTDYFWSKLSVDQRNEITSYSHYARVGCFKGFDEESFAFNTAAEEGGLDRQFDFMRRLIESGLDMYAYATFTAPTSKDIAGKMEVFVDRLQAVHPNLPLRTVPLEVQVFTPTAARLTPEHLQAMQVQKLAVREWVQQLEWRFTDDERAKRICDVTLRSPEQE
jgi:uncharacterized Fe-S cluster-containing radical SAM superfamily protein